MKVTTDTAQKFHQELLEMVKERASIRAKLSAIVIVCPRELIPAEKEKESRFARFISCVEYSLDYESPDTTPVMRLTISVPGKPK